MLVLTRVSHSDHDIGTTFECEDELAQRLVKSGTVVDAARWTYRYDASADLHLFDEHTPEEAPPELPDVARASDPITQDAPKPKTR